MRSGAYAAAPPCPSPPETTPPAWWRLWGRGQSGGPGRPGLHLDTLTGAYAEKTLCLESRVHHLPPQAAFAQGAGLNVAYSVAYRALFQRARAIAGEVVLVHGASGGVGIAAAQLARAPA